MEIREQKPKIISPIAPPNAKDWIILALLVVCGGSSFAAIRYAIETAPPSVVAAGRLWIATLVLAIYMKSTGRSMLPLRIDRKISRLWVYAAVIGLAGYTIPMTLFPFAQQTVSTMLAGIYMAFMPLATVFLAATFADEPLTTRKLLGFTAGTFGVLILIGPATLQGILSESLIAQLALIAATTCYAITTVVVRRSPPAPARSFAVAFMLCGALMITPAAMMEIAQLSSISGKSWLAILYLGVIPTGLTSMMIIYLIRSAGAGFMAMANYITPAVAIAIGIALFGEVLKLRYGVGLVAILVGLAIAQPSTLQAVRNWITRTPKA